MQDFLDLIETVPGQVALEVFAKKTGMSKENMRAELLINPPLAAYYCEIIKKVI